ncbi:MULTISPECIES: LysR family transcriptional regulator [Rhodomicrobium]|uniref:LysR family transcriptional regulator n=1 Tax=Rhodomicrobium TaxID=1068 RepID=UPI000B4B7DF3|nr:MULTISPECIES: LysR family transcriptional regulator [Rhodomicrobium]
MSETFKDIRLFVAVYEERSFTAAAEREHATQSGVSQHIRKLEDRFGARLFSRERGTVAPTPAGDSYYRRCIELLRAYQAADSAVRGYAGGLTGEIAVGLMPTMTRCALAPALSRFIAAHPNVQLRVVEAYSAVLTGQVRAGALDFAVVPGFPGLAGLKSRLFLRTPEVLVSRGGAAMTHMAPVVLKTLPPLKIVVPGAQNARRALIETYLVSNGIAIERMIELDAMMGTLGVVANSDWVTILPGIMMVSDVERPLLTINPIVGPILPVELVLIEPSRRVLSPAAQAFVDILQEETARLNAVWTAYLPEGRAG